MYHHCFEIQQHVSRVISDLIALPSH